MFRVFALCVMAIGTGVMAFQFPHSELSKGNQTDVESLKGQRVKLLQDRVAAIKKWVDLDRVGASELIRPKMDVINAQLDYADSNVERKKLLGELLINYDMLIESAELRVVEPGRPNIQMLAESELLHLKSERIRIQIRRDTLD